MIPTLADLKTVFEAFAELLQDTQHVGHDCGDLEHCHVLHARDVLALVPAIIERWERMERALTEKPSENVLSALRTVPISISQTRKRGENGLRNPEEIIKVFQLAAMKDIHP